MIDMFPWLKRIRCAGFSEASPLGAHTCARRRKKQRRNNKSNTFKFQTTTATGCSGVFLIPAKNAPRLYTRTTCCVSNVGVHTLRAECQLAAVY